MIDKCFYKPDIRFLWLLSTMQAHGRAIVLDEVFFE